MPDAPDLLSSAISVLTSYLFEICVHFCRIFFCVFLRKVLDKRAFVKMIFKKGKFINEISNKTAKQSKNPKLLILGIAFALLVGKQSLLHK